MNLSYYLILLEYLIAIYEKVNIFELPSKNDFPNRKNIL